MTELQLGLIGLGGVAILGVVAYNKWQERRHRRLAEQVLGNSSPDVLFEAAGKPTGAIRDTDVFAAHEQTVEDAPEHETLRTAAAVPPFATMDEASLADRPGDHPEPQSHPELHASTPSLGSRLADRFGFGRKATSPAIDVTENVEPSAGLDSTPVFAERIEPVLSVDASQLSAHREPEPHLAADDRDASQTVAPGEAQRLMRQSDSAAAATHTPINASQGAGNVPAAGSVPSMPASTTKPDVPSVSGFLRTASFDEPIAAPALGPESGSAAMPVVEPSRSSENAGEARADHRRDAVNAMLLSPLIDYVASFEAVEPASARQILAQPAAALARMRKPIYQVGFNEPNHEWEVISEEGGGEYRRFRIGLQLADRQGPASDAELSVFHVAMQDLADATLAIVDLPPRQQALATAAELDAFCAGVDIQIGINVISQAQVFPGTKLRALAEAAGMVMDIEGRFVRHDDDGNVLYVLLNQEAQPFAPETMRTLATHGVTFLLDVPCVAHGERVFNQMVDLARRFADVLRGVVVDDNRRPLSESALEPIRKQVAHYQSLLAAHHLPAGSVVTRRLFS